MISVSQFQTWLEHHGPIGLFVIGAVAGLYISLPEEKSLQGEFLGALTTLGALLASLTGVSISALLALKSDVAELLRKKGYYRVLMKYARSSIIASLLLVLIAIAGFVVIPLDEKQRLYGVVLSAVFFYALGAFYRTFNFLIQIGGFHREQKQ